MNREVTTVRLRGPKGLVPRFKRTRKGQCGSVTGHHSASRHPALSARKVVKYSSAFVVAASVCGLVWLTRVTAVVSVAGVVSDGAGRPVAQATVRVKGSQRVAVTDSGGRFSLVGITPALRTRITAWRAGFYIGGASAWPWSSRIEIRLERYATRDHPEYRWMPPSIEGRSPSSRHVVNASLALAGRFAPASVLPSLSDHFTLGCRDCHEAIYEQWATSAHAAGGANPRFLTLYNGTHVNGAQSPPTRYVEARDYGQIPLKPDPSGPDYGPGFKLDFPQSAGTCAACHLPSAALDRPFGSDPNHVTGTPARGTHCDFCHKTADVVLDARTHLPADNMPGVMSMRIVRPAPGSQLFFGPLDDVDGGRDARAPVMQQSEVCAPCHQGAFWGVPIYESFSEWRDSPYAREGKSCQSCHMAPDRTTTNIAPRRGGITREPATLATHEFPGATSQRLLRSAAQLVVTPTRTSGRLRVDVTVSNTGAGHRLPTDSPLREVLLIVTVRDAGGVAAPLLDGPTLPDWTGDLAGQPGAYFAKLLEQRWTRVMPSAAFWTHTRIAEDTRLAPRTSATHTFEFGTTNDSDVVVEARLIFRRAPYELMRQKGWRDPDIEMNRAVVPVKPAAEQSNQK